MFYSGHNNALRYCGWALLRGFIHGRPWRLPQYYLEWPGSRAMVKHAVEYSRMLNLLNHHVGTRRVQTLGFSSEQTTQYSAVQFDSASQVFSTAPTGLVKGGSLVIGTFSKARLRRFRNNIGAQNWPGRRVLILWR